MRGAVCPEAPLLQDRRGRGSPGCTPILAVSGLQEGLTERDKQAGAAAPAPELHPGQTQLIHVLIGLPVSLRSSFNKKTHVWSKKQ